MTSQTSPAEARRSSSPRSTESTPLARGAICAWLGGGASKEGRPAREGRASCAAKIRGGGRALSLRNGGRAPARHSTVSAASGELRSPTGHWAQYPNRLVATATVV